MPIRFALWASVLSLAVTATAGCEILERTAVNTPTDAVRQYIALIVNNDLDALRVCSRPFPHGYYRLLIGGIFEPVQALPGGDPARTLGVIDLDPSRLTFAEESSTGDEAIVKVGGTLVERFEPSEVEALFRAYAAESGQPLEVDLLNETLRNVSQGPVDLEVRESVPVILENGAWTVCPAAFTP